MAVVGAGYGQVLGVQFILVYLRGHLLGSDVAWPGLSREQGTLSVGGTILLVVAAGVRAQMVVRRGLLIACALHESLIICEI